MIKRNQKFFSQKTYKMEIVFLIINMIAVVLFSIALSTFPIQSDDLFFYLAVGKRFFNLGYFENIDPFLYSIPNYRWHIMHEWLSYILFYSIYNLAGFVGITIFKNIIVLTIVALIFWFALKTKSGLCLIPLLSAWSMYILSFRMIERSSLFSDLFSFLVLLITLQLRFTVNKIKLLFILPLIFLVWINLHPGFYIGLVILSINLIVDGIKLLFTKTIQTKYYYLLIINFFVCLIVLLINPLGINGFLYPFIAIFEPSWEFYRQYNYEWMPTVGKGYELWFSIKMFIGLWLLCMLCIVFWCYKNIRKISQLDFFIIIIFVFFTYLGFSAIRFINIAALAYISIIIYIMILLDIKLPFKYQRSISVLTSLILYLIFFKIIFFGYESPAGQRFVKFGIDKNIVPIKSAQFIDSIGGLKTNIFNQHDFGSYLCWHWNGKIKLFYHGFVTDLYFYKDNYLAVNESRQKFDNIVNKYNIGAFYLTNYPPNGPLLYRILYSDPQWHLIYIDPLAVIFVKDVPQNTQIIKKYSLNKFIKYKN